MPRATSAVPVLLLVVVAVLAGQQLLAPPVIGVADNGDYVRVMAPLGLAHVGTTYEDTVFLWVQLRYTIVPTDTSLLLPSAELLLAGVARGLDAAFSGDGGFDLRLLGGVHLAFYLAGIWLVLRATRTLPVAARGVVWTGVVLATPDVAYVAYLNSFYSEPASLIFLLMLVGVGLSYARTAAPGHAAAFAYVSCAALLVSTKPQNYALALPLAVFPIAPLLSEGRRRSSAVLVPLALALVLFGLSLYVRLPDLLRHPARWNGVFFGLLVDSPSPVEDLAEFGLEPELARWAGVRAVEIDGQSRRAPVADVANRYGFREVARFYARHPDRLVKVAERCARHTFVWRYEGIGNYTRESGKPPASQAPSLTGWSDMEQRLFPRSLWFLMAFFTLFVGIALWELRKGLDTPAARSALWALTLATMAVMAFAVVVAAGGLEDTVVDLFMFRVLFDVCLVTALAWIATHFARLLPARQAEAGPRG